MRALPLVILVAACVSTQDTVGSTDPDGQARWEVEARTRILAHDSDASGALDTDEVRKVACPIWRTLDESVRKAAGGALATVYGVSPGLLYRGERIGLSGDAREATDEALTRCIGVARAFPEEDPLAEALRAIDEFPNSEAWERRAARLILDHHDSDRSGLIDEHLEVRAISCATLSALDAGCMMATETPLAVLYGIAPGYVWVGGALGFAEAMRDFLNFLIVMCDLHPD